MITFSNGRAPARKRALASCVAALFGAVESAATAATYWPVTSCLDDGTPGTLRDVVTAASTVSGDVVDLSLLSCPGNAIVIQGGYAGIPIAQDSLKIYGPNTGTLTIDASGVDPTTYSAFYHTGSGTLTIRGLTITGGHVERQGGNGLGGCVYSRGNVAIRRSNIVSCSAAGDAGARGGGIYAKGNVLVAFSTVTGNTANGLASNGGGVFAGGEGEIYLSSVSGNTAAGSGGAARGGGVYAGTLVSIYGTISGNHATAPHDAAGGGWFAKQSFNLIGSTISGNSSSGIAGGGFAALASGMYNSTISGNSAGTRGGALYLEFNTSFYNSTIAFNTSGASAPGVLLHPLFATQVTLQSTLMSNNSVGSSDNDLSADPTQALTFNAASGNNLIRATSVPGLPADTKSGTCPLLGPLRDNGGLTRTHQLLSRSVAIDAGNDVTLDPLSNPKTPLAYDQRGRALLNGTTDYARVSGAKADIGAYEVQQDDVVFNAGFDGCNAAGP